MIVLLTLVHISVCVFLILVVLLQTGKGADLAGAFGGGGSQTAFGARGATTLLHKITTGAAVLFMATSLVLAILASKPSGSVVTDTGAPAAPVEDVVVPPAAEGGELQPSADPGVEDPGAIDAPEPEAEQPGDDGSQEQQPDSR